jgi:hypothetical protein
MLASEPNPRKTNGPIRSRIQVARPANAALTVETAPEVAAEDETLKLTPEAIRSYAVSIFAHSLLLLALGLWYFNTPSNNGMTLESRLAGSEFGLGEGTELLGGFDTPLGPAEGQLASPIDQPITVLKSELDSPEISSKAFEALPRPTPDAGGGGAGQGNLGVGSGEGFGIARFGNGGENIKGVAVKVGDPQFTLIWDTEADIDLHVLEPGGAEIFWEVRHGKRGGELDVDDVDGFGPENIYWMTDGSDGSRTKGQGPAGEYQWFVHYYGGFGGIAKQTNWKVRVKHEGKVEIFRGRLANVGQRSRVYNLKVSPKGGVLSELLKGVDEATGSARAADDFGKDKFDRDK